MSGPIQKLVTRALETGYLTVEAENQLRQMLKGKYSTEEFHAFMKLQQAAMLGEVKQQSRESRYCCREGT